MASLICVSTTSLSTLIVSISSIIFLSCCTALLFCRPPDDPALGNPFSNSPCYHKYQHLNVIDLYMYSNTYLNQTSSEPNFVFSLQDKLTNISYIWTLFKVLFIQGSVETGFTILAYKSNRKSTQKIGIFCKICMSPPVPNTIKMIKGHIKKLDLNKILANTSP